jgi:hypothetical protein
MCNLLDVHSFLRFLDQYQKVNDIDQENGEMSAHQANYSITHVWIDKQFIYYNLQCDSFSKQDTW